MAKTSTLLELKHPPLKKHYYSITSDRTKKYNCIAYAAGQQDRYWWPVPYEPEYYWPIDNPDQDESLAEFVEAFESLGYQVCLDDKLEEKYLKVAIYVGNDGLPGHMAKQLKNGKWSSKCGGLEDMEHDLDALCGSEGFNYGTVACFMKKER